MRYLARICERLFALAAVFFVLQFGFVGINAILESGIHPSPRAKIRATQAQLEQFRTAVKLYAGDNGQPPTAAQGLDALIHHPVQAPRPKHWKKYVQDLNEVPKDPWGNDYLYQAPGPQGEPFLITSYGADGKAGTRDDITSAALLGDGKTGG